ncbi:MAG: ZIP family metal transporter [Planctomycetota bacterium]|nr:ZIP family metal transporter [Planctomycetota bacterium]
MWEALAIFGVALLGGAAPLLVRWNDRTLHVALSLATGLFLGAVFLHLLPGVAAMEPPQLDSHGHAHDHGHAHGNALPWLFVLLGALGVYLFEALFLRSAEHTHDCDNQHKAVSMAAMAGLSVHALTAGVSYGLARFEPEVGQPMLVAILAHKGFESFSLTSVFQLAGMSRKTVFRWVVAFACVTPLGMALGGVLAEGAGDSTFGILQALAAGTFLFVCLGELLPEVFHHKDDGLMKLCLMALGIAGMWVLHGMGV